MKKIYILLLVLWSSCSATAQNCLPEGITFSTQGQINTFQTEFPGCTEIGGDVVISGYTITNLNGLNILTSIGGSLKIECNEALPSLEGLNSLSVIGGYLYVGGNLLLSSLSGLQHVTFIGEDVQISNNIALVNLNGLQGLTCLVGKLWINDNSSLMSLTGLNNVRAIGSMVKIYSNAELASLNGLEGLTLVGGSLAIGGMDHLGGLGNASLVSLMALDHVTSIGGVMDIGYNPILESLAGLNNIAGGSIQGLAIYNNDMLSECEIASICDYLANPAGNINISNNAPGCSSVEELEDACLVISTDMNRARDEFSVYPNPASDYIIVEAPPAEHLQLSLADLRGNKLFTREITGTKTPVSLSGLPGGIYLLRLYNDHSIAVKKIVKQ